MTHTSTQTNGGGALRSAGGPRAIRGRSAGGPRLRGAGQFFGPFCPLARLDVKSHHDDGDREQGAAQKPENEHRAQAPRAVGNQGFEGSKCY